MESKGRFNRQKNFFASLLCKIERRFFGKLDNRVVSDNRKFWKTVGPLFSEKAFHKAFYYNILNNNSKAISNNEEVAKIFNKHFSAPVEN